jgi:GTP-binding protein
MTRFAIVGRPNVGKSALFNRLLGRRMAIVDAESGVTRDRLHVVTEWQGTHFLLIDTGGLVSQPDELEAHIARQVEQAVAEADILLFTVDGQSGRVPLDDDVAARVRAINKPVWLVVSKADTQACDNAWTDFAAYGIERHFSVSALHGRGINTLLDAMAAGADSDVPAPEPAQMAIAILGRPNAGKSSLLNALVGSDRAIVSPVAGTTRDAVDAQVLFEYQHNNAKYHEQILLIDTAGIRRKRTIKTTLEYYAIHRAEAALARASVAILLMDAAAGVTTTDKKIAALIAEAGKGCVIGVNKWDLMKKATTTRAFTAWVRDQLPFVAYAPLVFLAAQTGENVRALVQRACGVHHATHLRISTALLNERMAKIFTDTPPPMLRGKRLKYYYATQVRVAPPRIVLFVNDPGRVQPAYAQYIIHQLRSMFDFAGAPVQLEWRSSEGAHR